MLRYVNSLGFDSEPDYSSLKGMLLEKLMENKLMFDKKFDW